MSIIALPCQSLLKKNAGKKSFVFVTLKLALYNNLVNDEELALSVEKVVYASRRADGSGKVQSKQLTKTSSI